jgi:hypothetical protein
MQFTLWFAVFIAQALTFVSTDVIAASHIGEEQSILIEVKEALVREAQSRKTEVYTTSWLTEDGQLHESTMIQSDMSVRGIQVKSYLDEMAKPKVEVTVDQKQGAFPACYPADNHLARTISLQVPYDPKMIDPSLSEWIYQATQLSKNVVQRNLSQSEQWVLRSQAALDESNEYQALLTGQRGYTTQYVLSIGLTASESPDDQAPKQIPGEDIVSNYLYGRPSAFPERWVKFSARLIDNVKQHIVWDDAQLLQVPSRKIQYTTESISDRFGGQITRIMASWMKALDQFAQCEPIRFHVEESGSLLTTVGGSDTGLEIGDRLLLLDEHHVINRLLEPGSLETLTLLKVIDMTDERATLTRVAGASIDRLNERIAIPF